MKNEISKGLYTPLTYRIITLLHAILKLDNSRMASPATLTVMSEAPSTNIVIYRCDRHTDEYILLPVCTLLQKKACNDFRKNRNDRKNDPAFNRGRKNKTDSLKYHKSKI